MSWVGAGLIVVSAVLTIEFLVAYHRSTGGAWRWSPFGRHIMYFTGALALILSLEAVEIFVVRVLGADDPPWFRAVRLGVFALYPVVVIWRRMLLRRAQREGSARD